MSGFVCTKCGEKYELSTREPKCKCGGIFDMDFKPPKFDLALIDKAEWSIFRYRRFMPLVNELWRSVTLGEGLSPIVRLDKKTLLKMDYTMPTLSFKDRGAAVLIWLCRTIGVKSVVQDSSGNAGNSVAAYCAKAGIECEIFVPENTSTKKINMIKAHGASVVIVKGSRDQTAQECRYKVETKGTYYASHVFNPIFYEGTKTYIYEIFEQLGRIPENIFIPLGNGTLFIGVLKALNELRDARAIRSMPKIFAIQSERCAPFKVAVDKKDKNISKIDVLPTMAEGIAIGEPMRAEYILKLVYEHNVTILTAKEDKILKARHALASKGIYIEHTTAATYAAYTDYIETHGFLEGDSILPMCGAGLKSDK